LIEQLNDTSGVFWPDQPRALKRDMTVTSPRTIHPYLQWLLTLSRSRRRQAASRLNYSVVLVIGLIAVGTLAAALIQGLDGWAITEVRRLPKEYIDFFEIVTDYGRSGWLLFPPLGALIILGVVSFYVRPGNPRMVVKSISARLWFCS
jgi:hypothetical protein